MGYYVEQINNAYKTDWERANKTLLDSVTPMHDTIKSIIEENDFPSKAEERWTAMLDKLTGYAADIQQENTAKFSEMIGRAEQFDSWYDKLKALEGDTGGDAGVSFAESHGFGYWKGSRPGLAPALGHATEYRWSAFASVTINAEGYIEVKINRREMVKLYYSNNTCSIYENKIMNSKTVTIKSSADFDGLSNGRLHDGLTHDENHGVSTFK